MANDNMLKNGLKTCYDENKGKVFLEVTFWTILYEGALY